MSHYSISERLQGMMCTEPVLCPSKPAVPAPVPPPVHTTLNGVHSRNSHQPHKDDLEGAYSLNSFAQPETMASFKNLTFAQITDQIWHFCTVDYGQRCMQTQLICPVHNEIHADATRYMHRVQFSILRPKPFHREW